MTTTHGPVVESSSGSGLVDLAPQFPVLDTMRAVGALAVLTTHTSFQTGEYLGNGVWGTLLARLDVGVAIFFVLSGFLLSRPYIARRALGLAPPAVSTYYEKRVLRIMPVYLTAVVVALLFVPGNAGAGVRGWLASFFLLDPYVGKSLPYGLTHMWSLSVEASFYLVLPGLMFVVGRRGPRAPTVALVLLAMPVVSVAWLCLVPRIDAHVAGAPGLWLPAYLSWFAAGIGLAVVHVQHQRGSTSRLVEQVVGLGRQPGVCWSLAIGVLLVAATPLAGPTLLEAPSVADAVTKHLLYTLVGYLLVLSGVFPPQGAYRTLMTWRPLRHLGHISYSIFCIHLAVLAGVFEWTGIGVFTGQGLRVWVITLGCSLVAAEVLYRLVEMPVLRVRRRLRAGESAASSTTSPETTTTTT